MATKSLVEKLTLGTVQFGLDYGINNPNGKPAREKSFEMLDFAYEKGIRVFDTAYAYGDAEEILGEFSQSRNLGDKIKIVTKLKPNIIAENPGQVNQVIKANLEESLKRLKRDYVDGYLFHTPEYIRNDEAVAALNDFKKQGLVKNIGVSIYEETDALYAAQLPAVDYIQIPYSIFDQRLNQTDFFQLAKKNGITVFARSAFLQGLFFMAKNKIPPHLGKVKMYFKDLDKIISQYGLTRQQAALMFSLGQGGIDFVVFGVDNFKQLTEDISLAAKPLDFDDCASELKNKFVEIEKNIIFPSLWKK